MTVDNDVNWAARAEHRHGRAAGVRDFVYLFLGEGLGCAVLSDGEVRRGHAGMAGEIAHVVTAGPGGEALRLTDVFAALADPAVVLVGGEPALAGARETALEQLRDAVVSAAPRPER